jgi:hypothetical protein
MGKAVMAHAPDKQQSRDNRQRVREVLMAEWDPIGVKDMPEAQDEYDAYVGKIYVMSMDESATREQIAAYLSDTEVERMGSPRTPKVAERCARTAEILIGMKPEFGAG